MVDGLPLVESGKCPHPTNYVLSDAGERDDRPTTAEREELAALRKENAQLKRANEILRTASAFFAAQLDPTRPR